MWLMHSRIKSERPEVMQNMSSDNNREYIEYFSAGERGNVIYSLGIFFFLFIFVENVC